MKFIGKSLSLIIPFFLMVVLLSIYASMFNKNIFSPYSSDFLSICTAFGVSVSYFFAVSFNKKLIHFFLMIVLSIVMAFNTYNYPIFSVRQNFMENSLLFLLNYIFFTFIFYSIWFNKSFVYFKVILATFGSSILFTVTISAIKLIFKEQIVVDSFFNVVVENILLFMLLYGSLNIAENILYKLNEKYNLNLYQLNSSNNLEE